MKGLFLLISCCILMLLSSLERVDRDASAYLPSDEMQIGSQEEETADVLYDDDTVTLLTTFNYQNDDVVPCRLNRLGRQLRVMTSRVQFRFHSMVLLVKRLALLLSVHLTTLINHISQSYSTLKLVCWQYAADCYVFAIRQIII